MKGFWIIFVGGLIMLFGVYFLQHLRYYGYLWLSLIWILIGILVFIYGLVEDLK